MNSNIHTVKSYDSLNYIFPIRTYAIIHCMNSYITSMQ